MSGRSETTSMDPISPTEKAWLYATGLIVAYFVCYLVAPKIMSAGPNGTQWGIALVALATFADIPILLATTRARRRLPMQDRRALVATVAAAAAVAVVVYLFGLESYERAGDKWLADTSWVIPIAALRFFIALGTGGTWVVSEISSRVQGKKGDAEIGVGAE